jgi:membrane protease YdiL (CAAX protease family)
MDVAPAADIGSASQLEIASSRWGVWTTFAWSLAALFAFVAVPFCIYLGWLVLEGVKLSESSSHELWRNQDAKDLIHIAGVWAGAGVVILAAHRSRTSVADYLALVSPRGRAAEVILASAAAFAVPALAMYVEGFEFSLSLPSKLTWLTLAAWIDTAVFVPVWEELLFRGLMYRGLARSRLGTWGAIGVTAVLFAVVHFPAERRGGLRLFNVTLIGVMLGWLRAHTGSLLPPIAVHAIWNGLAFIVDASRESR